MTADQVAARFDGAKPAGAGFKARCPVHEDAKPSLSIGTGADGRVVLNCFANCSTEAVLSAVGLVMADLFNDPPKRPANGQAADSRTVATYPYVALTGERLRKLRGADKTFSWQREIGGAWLPGLAGLKPGLYRIGELTGAVAWASEGEKDCDRARGLGLPCVCGPHGSNTWTPAHTHKLVNAGITGAIIVPDLDTPGLAYADRVASALTAAGIAVRVVRLPGAVASKHGADLSDYIDAGHGRADLEALAEAAPAWTPHADAGTTSAPDSDELPWARSLPDLIAEADQTTDEPPLITDFLMAGLITLLHGQPRDWKTIVALCVAIVVATGRALFGMARLSVPAPRNVLYLTEEDGKRRVTKRLQFICAGMGCEPPANLFVAAGTGFSLDDPECQGKLAAFVLEHQIGLVIADPLRSLSACVDQGPKELRPLTLALRSLMRETGCTILAVHHDSKPLALGVDARRRPQRASGGAVFSIADSPIGVDVLPDKRRLLTPTAWKFAEDPPAIVLSIESGVGFLRLVGVDADGATTAKEADLSGRVLAFLIANPRSSGTAIYKGLKTRKADVAKCLGQLAGIGKVDSVKKGRAALWFLVDEGGPDPCGTHRKHPENDPDPMGPDAGPIPADDGETLNDSMGPDVGTHADPCTTTGPDTGGGPRYGSRSYIGPILGTHATPDSEPLTDSVSAATKEPPDEVTAW